MYSPEPIIPSISGIQNILSVAKKWGTMRAETNSFQAVRLYLMDMASLSEWSVQIASLEALCFSGQRWGMGEGATVPLWSGGLRYHVGSEQRADGAV